MEFKAHPKYPLAENVVNSDYMALGEQFRRGDPNRIMSRSDLMNCASNPRRWLAGYREDETDTKSTRWGSLVDTMRTAPDRFEELYAVAPATYLGKGKLKNDPEIEKPWNKNATVCKEWEETQEAAGKTVIKCEELEEAKSAFRRMNDDGAIGAYLNGARNQAQIVATCDEPLSGLTISVRILIDLVPAGMFSRSLGDLKTTRSAAPEAYAKSIYSLNYDAQAALILDIWNATQPDERDMFHHVVQENFAPFECQLYFLSEEFLQAGRIKYESAIRTYCRCLHTGHWPGFRRDTDLVDSGAICIEPPNWVLKGIQ